MRKLQNGMPFVEKETAQGLLDLIMNPDPHHVHKTVSSPLVEENPNLYLFFESNSDRGSVMHYYAYWLLHQSSEGDLPKVAPITTDIVSSIFNKPKNRKRQVKLFLDESKRIGGENPHYMGPVSCLSYNKVVQKPQEFENGIFLYCIIRKQIELDRISG